MRYWILSASPGENPIRNEMDSDLDADLSGVSERLITSIYQWKVLYQGKLEAYLMNEDLMLSEELRELDKNGYDLHKKLTEETGNKVKYYSELECKYIL